MRRDRVRVGAPVRDWLGAVGKVVRGAAPTYRASAVDGAASAGASSVLLSPSVYTGAAVGDLMVCFLAAKPYTCSWTLASVRGYTQAASVATGTTAVTEDGGSVRMVALWRVRTASESGSSCILATNDGSKPIAGFTAHLGYIPTGTGGFVVEATTAAWESGTAVDADGAATLPACPGDVLLVAVGQNSDAVGITAATITVPGCALGAATQRVNSGYAGASSAPDLHLAVWEVPVTAGFATGPPNLTATATGDGICAVAFLLVRGRAV